MGGSTGTTNGGWKESPETGAGFVPLIALGIGSMAALAVIAAKKRG